MNRVRAVDAANATLTVEAGVPLAARAGGRRATPGCMFPLSLAAEGSCTIGGNLSTNAGGTAVLRYGNARELTLGHRGRARRRPRLGRAARPAQGQHRLRPEAALHRRRGHARHHHRGGAEALPAPRDARRRRSPRSPTSPRRCACSARSRQALGDRLTGFELMSALLARAVAQAPSGAARSAARPPVVRAGAGRRQRAPTRRSRRELERALGARDRSTASRVDATIAQSGEQARALWALRENIAEAQRREGPNIKHDISLPVSAIPRFLDDARGRARRGASRRALRHLRPPRRRQPALQPRRRPKASTPRRSSPTPPRANRIVHDLVAAHGGSISAEHGIGQQKRDELVRYKSAVELELMRADQGGARPRGHPQSRARCSEAAPWARSSSGSSSSSWCCSRCGSSTPPSAKRARRRRERRAGSAAGARPMVRCVHCGVFLPQRRRHGAVPGGLRLRRPGCAARR